jgi:AbrB family looped-hinge helix DNA binding protein
MEEPEITTVSKKGQVVIPRAVRKKLKLKPKTKLLVYGVDDTIILKKLSMPDVKNELEELYRKIDERISKYGELSEAEIAEEIRQHRKKKRA